MRPIVAAAAAGVVCATALWSMAAFFPTVNPIAAFLIVAVFGSGVMMATFMDKSKVVA